MNGQKYITKPAYHLTDPFHNRLEKELEKRKNLLRRIEVYKPCRLNLSSNDYLQLRFHPKVIEAAITAIKKYGSGSGASPLLSGFLPCHDQLIKQLLEWKGKKSGMLFNTGFMANQALLKHLPGKCDLMLVDRLIHHSMAQALTQSKAKFKRYDHLDLSHLEDLLRRNHKDYETVFVATESVFSMDGDYPDLPRLMDIKSRYPFCLILDEAHATGIFGKNGCGLAEEMGVSDKVDIIMGTLGKSLASMGAYVLTNSSTVTDYLINFAGEFIYSTFLSPAQAGAASAAIEVIRAEPDKRRELQSVSAWFRRELTAIGWPENHEALASPIIPIVVDEVDEALELKKLLLKEGILVGAVRPPTVPTPRLRISLHSGVTQEHLKDMLKVLKQWKKK